MPRLGPIDDSRDTIPGPDSDFVVLSPGGTPETRGRRIPITPDVPDPDTQTPPIIVRTKPRPDVKLPGESSSKESAPATFSTLFHGFSLTATPTYNFFVDGEDADGGTSHVDDVSSIPRYVTLAWVPTPPLAQLKMQLPDKTTRQPTTFPGTGIVPSPLPSARGIVPVKTAKTMIGNGFFSPGTIFATVEGGPSRGRSGAAPVDVDSFLDDVGEPIGTAGSALSNAAKLAPSAPPTPRALVVGFVDPAIVGILGRSPSATSPEHAEAIVGIASALPGLEALSSLPPPVEFVPPPALAIGSGEVGRRYIGYVIEKHALVGGAFTKVAEFDVDDPARAGFVDGGVSYGTTYRYRIKAILAWVRPTIVDGTGLPQQGSPTVCSFFDTPWCDRWAYATVVDEVPPPVPDEVTGRPLSPQGVIHVTWKIPDDPQRDLSGFRLLRREEDLAGGELVMWRKIGDFPLRNGLYVDRDVKSVERGGRRYVYAVQTLSRHGETSLLSDQVRVSIRDSWARDGETPVELASAFGVSLQDHGPLATRPSPELVEDLPFSVSARVSARQTIAKARRDDSSWVAKVESLDTGERWDVPFVVSFRDLVPRIFEVSDIDEVDLGRLVGRTATGEAT